MNGQVVQRLKCYRSRIGPDWSKPLGPKIILKLPKEEEKILAVAPPFLRALVTLILETAMRSHREALALMWDAIHFANDSIRVRESKTRAGIRNVPLTAKVQN